VYVAALRLSDPQFKEFSQLPVRVILFRLILEWKQARTLISHRKKKKKKYAR
jgi:hypothetical protein